MLGTISCNLQAELLCPTLRNTRLTYPWNVSWDLIRHIVEEATVLNWGKKSHLSVQVSSVINVGSGSTLYFQAEQIYVHWIGCNACFANVGDIKTHFFNLNIR